MLYIPYDWLIEEWSCPQKAALKEDKGIRVHLSITGAFYVT